jgi:predicted transcriptional regulator of viral defense system
VAFKSNSSTLFQRAEAHVRGLGIFRTGAFVAAGYPREYLLRLVRRGAANKLGRDLYCAADFDGNEHVSLVQAAIRVPRGVICLSSALQFHGIGTQAPHQVWLAIPQGANATRVKDLPIHFCKFSKASHEFGVQAHKVAGGIIRVYSPAKTVADCFKYRGKFGLDVSVEALRDGWRLRKFTLDELLTAADVCRVRRVIQPYLEMLT